MKVRRGMYSVVGLVAVVVVVTVWQVAGAGAPEEVPVTMAAGANVVPAFEVDPLWPKPLPNDWIVGQVAGVAVDAQDHVWIVHRPNSLTELEAGAAQDPPISRCCIPAPSVLEFDQEGNLVQAWGGPESAPYWPESEHGLHIDHEGNVWIGSNGPDDHVVLKFSPEGEFLLQIGEPGQTGGSNSTTLLGGPADMVVDAEANEVYIADGYVNRRVVVFDATKGEYKRHWGAYGEEPNNDVDLGSYDPDAPPARQFRGPVHGIRISNDGLVYVADRRSNRIQVFQKDGTFVEEASIAPETPGNGSVWHLAFSRDPEQTYLYVPDGANKRIWILRRTDLAVMGSFGTGGRNAGQFDWVHNLAVDSRGNLYTSEVNQGKRVQRFSIAGMMPVER